MTRLAAGISFVFLIAMVGLVNTVLNHVEHAFAGQRILVEKSMSLAKGHLLSNFTASAHQGEDLTAYLAEDLDFVLPVVQGVRSVKRTEGKVERGSYRRFSAARRKIEFHWDKFRENYPECQSLTVIGTDGRSIFTTSPFVMDGSLSAQWLKGFSESAADEGRSRYVVLDGEVRLLSTHPIFEDLAETPIAHVLVELVAPAIGKHGDFHVSFVESEKLVSGAKLPDGVELNSLHSENAQAFGHEPVIASLPGVGLEVSRRPLLFEVVSADVVGLKFKVPNLDSAEIALWFSLVAVEQRILELQYRFFLASCILLLLGVVAVFYLCSRVQRGVGNLCEVVVGMLQGFDLSIDHVPSQRVSRELVGLRNLITKLFQRLGEVDSAETKASPKDEVFFQASREEMVNFDGLLNSTPEVVNGDDSAAAASGLVVIPVPIQGGQVSVEAPSSDGFSDLDSLTLETEYVPWDSEAGTVIKKEDPSLMGGIATWDEFRLETNLSVSSEEFDEVADNLDVEVPLSSPVGGGIATSVMEVSPELIEKLRLADGFEDAKEAEADFKRLYDLFLSERQGCGQQGLVDYDKFVERLKASESKVRSQKPNANVRFEIYRKDGRAAIRAIPS